MRHKTVVATAVLLLVASAAAPVSAASGNANGHAYAGSNVTFDAQDSAMANYTVDGHTVVQRLGVQSTSKASSSGSLDVGANANVDLGTLTDVDFASISVGARTETGARVTTESGATVTANDDDHGVLVVDSGGKSQVVVANVSADASASASGENRVTVTSGDGTETTFVAVGNASVDVNENGDVASQVGANGKLVARTYPQGKTKADEHAEEYVASGLAVGEAYATAGANASGDAATSTVTYANDTTIEAAQTGESTVNVTVDRTAHQGKVVVTTVSKDAVGSLDDVSVTVDGEAAVEASSYADLESAVGSDHAAYVVKQQTEGQATVFVAFNHFSTHTASISGANADQTTSSTSETSSSSSSSTSDGSTSSGSSPGFGLVAGAGALLAFAAFARRD